MAIVEFQKYIHEYVIQLEANIMIYELNTNDHPHESSRTGCLLTVFYFQPVAVINYH